MHMVQLYDRLQLAKELTNQTAEDAAGVITVKGMTLSFLIQDMKAEWQRTQNYICVQFEVFDAVDS